MAARRASRLSGMASFAGACVHVDVCVWAGALASVCVLGFERQKSCLTSGCNTTCCEPSGCWHILSPHILFCVLAPFSGEWNACVLASEGQKAVPFLDGGVHVEKIEAALADEQVALAWKHWRAFKRAGVGLDEDVVNLKNQVFTLQQRLVAAAKGSLELAGQDIKAAKVEGARQAWMEAQVKFTSAGVIAETVGFDDFTNVKGRLIPADNETDNKDDVLMEDATRTKFADQLAQMHTDIRQSEIILRALRRMNAKLMVLCFERWNDRVEYLQYLREVARKVIMRMINLQLASVFHRWEWEWAVSKKARNLFHKVKAHGIHHVLVEWDAVVQEVSESAC